MNSMLTFFLQMTKMKACFLNASVNYQNDICHCPSFYQNNSNDIPNAPLLLYDIIHFNEIW